MNSIETLPRALPRGIVFDLYGTLLRLARPRLQRELPRALHIPYRPWMNLVRQHLLTSAFEGQEKLVEFIIDELACRPSIETRQAVMDLVADELASVEPFPGVFSLLSFLRQKQYKLGLISNLTSIHKRLVADLGLFDYFDAMCFSCDEGMTKPAPEIYLKLCTRLNLEPEEVLMVGDSLRNDVEAPRALGMKALLVGRSTGTGTALAQVSELGWMLVDGYDFTRLLKEGDRFELRKRGEKPRQRWVIREMSPLSREEQGRYNLVTRVGVAHDTASPTGSRPGPTEMFAKRYSLPGAAYVEDLAHRVWSQLGLGSCETAVLDDREPLLIMTGVSGSKFQIDELDPALAFEVARHAAASYIFSNADFRPRNAFLSYDGSRPRITIIDLEYCFFNLAMDLDGLENPFDPATVDRLSQEELTRRIRRRVLSERTTKRAMRSFLELDRLDSELGLAFKAGWVATFEAARAECEAICEQLQDRIYQKPFLIIGTRSYRRAMARVDIDEIRARLWQDPEAIFPKLAAVKAPAAGNKES